MSLIVEDGSAKADSESYASVAMADLFHDSRGNAAWSAMATAAKEVALRKATDWLGERFGGQWLGNRATAGQALHWPRLGVCVDGVAVASNALPASLVRATCELALKASAAPLTQDEGAQIVSETVGPIATTYAAGARQQTRFAAVEHMLASLVSSRHNIRLVRA